MQIEVPLIIDKNRQGSSLWGSDVQYIVTCIINVHNHVVL